MNAVTAPARWFSRHSSSSPNTLNLKPNTLHLTPDADTFWALKGVSFEVQQGEVVGIIGRNGAGKSTLLKILSRITEPTEGEIRLRGRVASLLEVGTGFHPELTGRENIYLNGAILGMRKEEIKRKFDEIVAFAEVEKFLDTPVKRYSSGMYVRLAFAVAAHLEPEILLVDEVLAVGDAAFQKKCLGKMDEVAKGGRTVLFVSHQLGQIDALCSKCILLEGGKINIAGETSKVINAYINSLKETTTTALRDRKDRVGNGLVRIVDTWIEDENGYRIEHLLSGSAVKIVAQYEVADSASLANVLFSFAINNFQGVWVADLNNQIVGKKLGIEAESGRVECIIPKLCLNSGAFNYNVMVRSGASGYEVFDFIKNANTFNVEPGKYFEKGITQKSDCLIVMEHDWQVVD